MIERKLFAFVLMPFAEEFNDIYKLGIKDSCEKQNFIAERVDEQIYSENILERIYRQIKSADVIVADMSGRNPNVFYEVGYAHALGKPCILLTENAEDIPFDLSHHRHIVYNGSIQKLQECLSKDLAWHKKKIDEESKKQISVKISSIKGLLSKNSYAAHGTVDIGVDVQNVSGRRIREIEAIYLHTGEGWKFLQDRVECSMSKSTLDDYKLRHFIKPSTPSLSPDTWAPIAITGKKALAYSYEGERLLDSYHLAGHVTLEIVTESGTYREKIELDVTVDEIPF